MNYIDYFKLQAKNLFRDYKTHRPTADEGYDFYDYEPKFFDIDSFFLDYDIDEKDFCLMKAQHLIAQLVGFESWGDLLKASASRLELAKLLFDNQDKLGIEDWESYLGGLEFETDDESELEIFKQVFLDGYPRERDFGQDYRINIQTPAETYEEVKVEDKAALYERHFGKSLNSEEKIYCFHCNQEFTRGEFKVVKKKSDGKLLMMCKHFPKCDGSIYAQTPLDYREKYESKEIAVKDKLKYYREHEDKDGTEETLKAKVDCLHCGNIFELGEFKVVRDGLDGLEGIRCKHWPECNGRAWDLMPAGYNNPKGDGNEK